MRILHHAAPVLLAALVLFGCNFKREEHGDFCRESGDCGSNERCVQSFCVRMESDAGGSRDAAVDAGRSDGGGMAGEPCSEGQPAEPCYDGEAATQDVGMCRGGERACVGGVYTQCLGQVLPSADECNGKDDDCDDTIDEIEASCPASGTGLHGICQEGVLACSGVVAVCSPVNEPSTEECNGLDDDCDQETDEIVAVECFPVGATGCTDNRDGTYACSGTCASGATACSEGQTQCADAVTAAEADACAEADETAADEDCDTEVDEGCPCSTGETRPCYGGPEGTVDNPPCAAGMQVCVGGFWGACQNQTLPGIETCQNLGEDNDCDGTVDDGLSLGTACIDDSKMGICRDGTRQCMGSAMFPTCVGQAPQTELCDDIDQNCNGDPDDGFDLNTDANCGRCNNKCEGDSHCCNLACRSPEDFRHDAANCGECGKACGDGYYCCWNDCIPGGKDIPGTFGGREPPDAKVCGCKEDCKELSCCGEKCVDLENDDANCGACGNDCTATRNSNCCNGECTSSDFCLKLP
jgi:hypothetical protein